MSDGSAWDVLFVFFATILTALSLNSRATTPTGVVWMLGNLARASFVGSSDFVWPFSYNKCNPRNRHSQEINACSAVNHYGLDSFTGRGSPEIDILESMQGEAAALPSTFITRPYQSTSLQVAPGIEIDRPTLGLRPEKVR
jgi:beta-glucan synthesis-associated protein KRE6